MDRVVVVVDTREQEEYTFDRERIEVVRRALPAGDYSLEGWEDSVAVERKSLEDFVSTAIRDRDRFRRELRRLEGYQARCVVVEAELRSLISGDYRSGAHPHSVFGSVVSIIVDYGVPVFFCSDRQVARLFVEEYLLRYHRKVGRPCQNKPSPADR